MKATLTAKLIAIGNSRGVRLPKELIAQAGLEDEIELIVRDGEIILANRRHPREGWAKAFEEAAARGELELDDEDKAWIETSLTDELDEWN